MEMQLLKNVLGGGDEGEQQAEVALPNVVTRSNIDQFIERGLGEDGIKNYELAKVTLESILFGEGGPSNDNSKCAKTANAECSPSEDIKLPPSHDLFVKIAGLIEHGLKTKGEPNLDKMYPSVTELSMTIVYKMCTEPSEWIEKLISKVHGLVFVVGNPERGQVDPFKFSERLMFRYVSFGKALFNAHITHYENVVTSEVEQRKLVKGKASKKNKSVNKPGTSSKNNISSASSSSKKGQANENVIDYYLTVMLEPGFCRTFKDQVIYLCKAFDKTTFVNLKVVLIQALARLMLVGEKCMETNLELFKSIWNRDESFPVKLEVIKAGYRLSAKFPLQMERMNESLATGLSSKVPNVRKACVDYISYLCMENVLKVSKYFPDLAACLIDDCWEIRDITMDNINQLSTKHQDLLDCILGTFSRLSEREDISQIFFQFIMQYLFQKVKKEDQIGDIVERLLAKLNGVVTVRVCQDTIYCINQIQQNERTLDIMKDGVSIYADKLGDPVVWDLFTQLVAKFRKLNKSDLKTKIDEWEQKLDEHYSKGVSQDDGDKVGQQNENDADGEAESSSDDEERVEEGKEAQNDGTEDKIPSN